MIQRIGYGFLLLFVLQLQFAFAQLNAPEAEEVYGGRINWIDAGALDAATTRLYISTESANSLFYTHVNHSVTPAHIDSFTTLPDVDGNDGFGSSIFNFAVDGGSGRVFFTSMGNLYSADITPGSIATVESGGVFAVACYQGWLFYLKDEMGSLNLHFGVIDSLSGSFSEDTNSPLTVTSGAPGGMYSIMVNPASDSLFIFQGGNPPVIYCSSTDFQNLSSTTSFLALDVSGLGGGIDYRAFGIGPDGRLFVGAVHGMEPQHFKFIGYTDNNGLSWDTLSTAIGGTAGPNIACAGTVSDYYVYFGSAVSNNKGESGTWQPIAWGSFETHPNDGVVAFDPNDPSLVFLSTDQGIGASDNHGADIFEIDDGVEAVQVNDFDMNGAKSIAWTASKSGIRRVTDYATASENWEIFFPNGDGSPYYSIAMDTSDASGNTAYAGNVRVYKTADGGVSWTRVFTVEDTAWHFDFWSYIAAIEIHPQDPDVVVVGVNSPSMGVSGGLFYSMDGGMSWLRLDTTPYNTEVKDLAFAADRIGNTYLYVACEYVSDGATSSYGVKTVIRDSSGMITFENDMIGAGGTLITNFGANSLAMNSNGDVYAAGRKGSSEEPRVYVMPADSTHWELLPYGSLPGAGSVSAITIGYDSTGSEAPYIAINSDIYYLPAGSSTWAPAYQYPVGSRINVLYWDDLLVGTGTGLYGHQFNIPTGIPTGQTSPVASNLQLYPNYPNPFNPSTTIEYRLPSSGQVSLKIYDLTGRLIRILVHQYQQTGVHQVAWDGRNVRGEQVGSGIYFYQLKMGAEIRTRKMILIQ